MNPIEAAENWLRRGFHPIPVPFRNKAPVLEAWQNLRITKHDLHGYFDNANQNVGVLLGDECGSADVDCDCLEAIAAAVELAPATDLVFGRNSKPASHYFYRSKAAVRSEKFTDPSDNKITLVELRAQTSNGSIGLQTVVPPSVHTSGQPIRFEPGCDGEPGEVETRTLTSAVSKIAAVALLSRHWPKEGARHDAFLALAGVLSRAGWLQKDAISFHRAIYRALWGRDADLHACEKEVQSTFAKQAQVGETTGFTTLSGLIDRKILQTALNWIGVSIGASSPTRAVDFQEKNTGKESQATKLIKLVSDLEYFHSPHGQSYVTFLVDGHQETHGIHSKGFKIYLQRRFYTERHHTLSMKAIQDVIGALESKAVYEGEEHAVYSRVGELDNNIYIDLGSNQWDAIEVTREGWAVMPKPAVKFRRARGILPIPHPVRTPEASAKFAELVNVKADTGDLQLITAWLLAAMRPKGPFPVLVLNSEHGSGKTTVSRVIRNLLDPNEAPMRALPKDERDLMIAASNGWIIALDNVSHLPDWLSDALCRLSTGGGFATRELYTNEDEVLFNVQRPVILNGIEELATRGDLMDRAIVIELPQIPAGKRLTEREFWLKSAQYRPVIIGYFLDALSGALGNIGDLKVASLPRMADFAELIVAAEASLGWLEGDFLKAYGRNRDEATEVAIDASTVARHLLRIGSWSGTATALMAAIETRATDQEKKSTSWPKSPRSLSNAIRRLTPLLRKSGLEVMFKRDSGTSNRERLIVLKGTNSS